MVDKDTGKVVLAGAAGGLAALLAAKAANAAVPYVKAGYHWAKRKVSGARDKAARAAKKEKGDEGAAA